MSEDEPIIQFGIETEFGISRDGAENLDVVTESIDLVRSATAPGVSMRWDYESEDPHADARGFRVEELRQDTDEADYFQQDEARSFSFTEIKSDLVLANGARFYNDHAHPEYCTPECSLIEELVAHDRAGERIVMACAEHLSQRREAPVRIYKNNTDFLGHSYGCHENYLLPRSLLWDRLAVGIQAFLVTRQIFAGAGKFGLEAEDRFLGPGFQISQRADFFSELQSVDTMQRRPLVNTRDEPHANPERYRRFHVILGDANMSSFATWLKVGATALVLESLCRQPAGRIPEIERPVETLKSISRDGSFAWELTLLDAKPSNAIEVQRQYLERVRDVCDLSGAERAELAAEWERVLEDLEEDPMLCRDRLDWVAKRGLIREFQAEEGIPDDDPWLRSLDLEYHRLDLRDGLFFDLERTGALARRVADAEVAAAMATAPPTTRAWIRGECVRRFPKAVISAQWDHVTLQGSRGPMRISLLDAFGRECIERMKQILAEADHPDDLQSLAAVPQ